MKRKTFDSSKLSLHNVQYSIRHTKTSDFKVGEKVFLKSNPEHPMVVIRIDKKYVITEEGSFIPETILQYRYRGLTYNPNLKIKNSTSLN